MGERLKAAAFMTISLSVALLCALFNLTMEQIIAVTIFSSMIAATLLFWRFRLAIGFLGLALLFAFKVIDVEHFIKYAGLDVIVFLIGTMIIIGYLEERGFFGHMLEKIMGLARGSPLRAFYLLMIASFIMSALVNEVTSILFITALVLRIAGLSGLNPVPLMIMTVFATNIGSSATVVGNPIGVMIALRGGLTFIDFLWWASPVAITVLLITMFFCIKYYRSYIESIKVATAHTGESEREEGHLLNWLIFGGTIGGLILHGPIESLLGLKKGTMLIGTALLFAAIVLLIARGRAREIIERHVDWWTLSFFLVLFASVGTLKYVGITKLIATGFMEMGFRGIGLYVIFTYLSGFMTALMDNILAVATFIPVVQELGAAGIDVAPYWWALLFSGTYMGNLTPIGSTANIVAIGIVERRHRISFKEWLKIGVPVSLITVAAAIMIMILRTNML